MNHTRNNGLPNSHGTTEHGDFSTQTHQQNQGSFQNDQYMNQGYQNPGNDTNTQSNSSTHTSTTNNNENELLKYRKNSHNSRHKVNRSSIYDNFRTCESISILLFAGVTTIIFLISIIRVLSE